MLFNKSPYAIVARKSRGIHALSDIEGKTLGVADGDLSIRLWPALARQNGIKIANVKLNKISAAVREPMLSAGQVDAVPDFPICRRSICGIAACRPTTSRCFDMPTMAARPMASP